MERSCITSLLIRLLLLTRPYLPLLAASVKLFTTKCVIDELNRLGESHSEALQAAYELTIARCEHQKKKSADACIIKVIGEKNPEHFFVATQDVDLQKKLQEVLAHRLLPLSLPALAACCQSPV